MPETSEIPIILQAAAHTLTFAAAIGATVFFYRLYGSLGTHLRNFLKWILPGLALLALSHVLSDALLFVNVSHDASFFAGHAINFTGLALIAIGAFKLYQYSETLRV